MQGRGTVDGVTNVGAFAVTGLVLVAGTTTDVTVDSSVTVVLSNDLVLVLLRGRSGSLWLDFDDSSSGRRPRGV